MKVSPKSLKNLKSFPKGVSGNPGGRPKGITSFSKLLRDAGHQVEPKSGKTYAQLAAEAIVKERMAKGDVAAADFYAERTDGKVADKVEIRDRRAELEQLRGRGPEEVIGGLVAKLNAVADRLGKYAGVGRDSRGGDRGHPRGRGDRRK